MFVLTFSSSPAQVNELVLLFVKERTVLETAEPKSHTQIVAEFSVRSLMFIQSLLNREEAERNQEDRLGSYVIFWMKEEVHAPWMLIGLR